MASDAFAAVQLVIAVSDSHIGHEFFRLVSLRARRAAFRVVSSRLGMSFPVSKYISSGVWPQNAECERRVLCSSKYGPALDSYYC